MRVGQWMLHWLWTTWLQHEFASKKLVFLPREHSLLGTSLIVVFYVSVLGWVFREGGGKIQNLFKVNLPLSLLESKLLLI